MHRDSDYGRFGYFNELPRQQSRETGVSQDETMYHTILHYLHFIILTCLNAGHEVKISSHVRFFLQLLDWVASYTCLQTGSAHISLCIRWHEFSYRWYGGRHTLL